MEVVGSASPYGTPSCQEAWNEEPNTIANTLVQIRSRLS